MALGMGFFVTLVHGYFPNVWSVNFQFLMAIVGSELAVGSVRDCVKF
jgi:hypothetical protein